MSDQDAPYINGDPSIGRAGSIPPAEAFEHPMRELANVIINAGLTPNESDLEQIWKSMQIAPWITEYAQDTSAVADAVVAAIDPVPPSLIVGTTVRIKVANTNTGVTTFSLNSFGTYNVKKANGTVLEAGDLTVGQIVTLVWTGSEWQINNYLGSEAPVTTNTYQIDIPYAADTGTASHVVANFSPDINAAAAGDVILVKAAYTNLGATDIVCDVQSAKAVVRPNGASLVAGDIVAGQMMMLLFDGTAWQLINPIKWFTDTGGGGDPTGSFVPGVIYLWPTEAAPTGTLECNGSAISRTQYSRLFGIIGTMYGTGNGTTTFNLPDYRGLFPRGWDHGAGIDPTRGTRTNRGDGVTGDHVGTKEADGVGGFTATGTITINGEYDPNTGVTAVMGESGYGWNPMYFPAGTSLIIVTSNADYAGPQFYADGAMSSYPLTKIRGQTSLDVTGIGETRPKNINTMYVIAY